MTTTLIGIIITLVIIIVTYFKWRYKYWQKRGVPFPQPIIPMGNMGNRTRKKQHVCIYVDAIYKEMKSNGHKYAGIYMFDSPVFVPIDINLVKDILATDFSHFVNHGFYYNEKVDPLSAHIIALEDDRWRNLRSCLTPAFSIGKCKLVYNALKKYGILLREEIIKLTNSKEPLKVKDLAQRYVIDSMGEYNFGIECNSIKNPNSEFKEFCYKCFETSINIWVFFTVLYPKLSKSIGLRAVQKDVSDFFFNVISSTVKYRDLNNIKKKDLINLLMDLRNNSGPEKLSFTLNDICAQAFIFFQAGYETSALTIHYCLFELSLNQEIQKKVRMEILYVLEKYNNEVTYEAVREMKYLDSVIQETLRKYPPTPILFRKCNKDYKIPNSNVTIEEGTTVYIPAYSIHYDPEYYPDPEKFQPERFFNQDKSNLNRFTYLPFGEGPRICIGMQFGLLQIKMALITVLKEVKLQLNSKTPKKLNLNPNAFTCNCIEDVYLDAELLN